MELTQEQELEQIPDRPSEFSTLDADIFFGHDDAEDSDGDYVDDSGSNYVDYSGGDDDDNIILIAVTIMLMIVMTASVTNCAFLMSKVSELKYLDICS